MPRGPAGLCGGKHAAWQRPAATRLAGCGNERKGRGRQATLPHDIADPHCTTCPIRPVAVPPRQAAGMTTFAVSRVRLDDGGRITAVLWGEVDTGRNDWASAEVVAPVGDAVDALNAGAQVFALFPSAHGHLPQRRFVIADYDGARRTIVLDGLPTFERNVHDMDRLDGPAP